MTHADLATVRTGLAREPLPPPPPEPMTVEEYLAYCAIARPDGKKWELIEGKIVAQDSATDWHQVIVGNVVALLSNECMRLGATWTPLPGIGTRVPSSPKSLPEPDVMVKEHPLTGLRETTDGLVLFEVHDSLLARSRHANPARVISNRPKDKRWKLEHYQSVANCRHFVTIEQDRPLVARHDRADGWRGVALDRLDDTLALPARGVALPLRAIYWRTPVAG